MIHESMIVLEHPFREKEEVINYFSHLAKEQGFIMDVPTFISDVAEREKAISTAVGHGIAIPHGKSEACRKPFVGFMRVTKPIVWDERHEVGLIFIIGVPKEAADTLYLRYIAEISKKLMHDEFRAQLGALSSKEEVYTLLQEIRVE